MVRQYKSEISESPSYCIIHTGDLSFDQYVIFLITVSDISLGHIPVYIIYF